MSPTFGGVDAGGTRTRVLLVDGEGEELGSAQGPGAVADPGAPEVAAEAVAAVVREAARAAGIPLPLEALWAGLAGAGRESARTGVESALGRMGLATRVRVGTDVEAAFHEAFAGGPGILLLAGTGSVALGRGEDGTVARVGGWGSVLGDEGSGWAIGVEGLRRVARDADGRGRETALGPAILEALGLGAADELIPWARTAGKGEVAALVPVVARTAEAGDPVAREILAGAVAELEGHVHTLLASLGPWSRPPTVALAGGLLDPGGPLRTGVEAALHPHQVTILPHLLRPVRGAALLALQS